MKVIRVQFKKTGKRYYFSCGQINVVPGDYVVVNTVRGLEIGIVSGDSVEITDPNTISQIKEILRKATKKDLEEYEANIETSALVVVKTREFVSELGLDMKILEAEYTLDKAKLIISFESELRIDFRELVKKLADTYHTRIELRQVGSRDGAKEIGGIGPCGLVVCCKTFLTEFSNVSIKMAKNQGLSLNPTKISGICSKLLCCISYENDFYTELRKGAPDINDIVETSKGRAKVLSVDVLNKGAKIKYLDDDSFDYPKFDDMKIVQRKKKFNEQNQSESR